MSQFLQEVQTVAEGVEWQDGLTAHLFHASARVEITEVGAPDSHGRRIVTGVTGSEDEGWYSLTFIIPRFDIPAVGSTVEVFGLFAESPDGYGDAYLSCVQALDIDTLTETTR